MSSFITVGQAAKLIGCSQTWIHTLRKNGLIEWKRPGNEYFLKKYDVMKFSEPGGRNPRVSEK